MGCQCSKNDSIKEQIFKDETNTDQSIDSKNLQNLQNNSNLIIKNTIDSNLSKELNNRKIYTFQNTNQLIYQLFQNINKIRMNPMSIIEKIEMYKSNIFEKDGKILFDCGNKIYSILTKGKTAFDDCIRFLSTQKSIEPLELNNDLKIELTIDNELEKNIVSYAYVYIKENIICYYLLFGNKKK